MEKKFKIIGKHREYMSCRFCPQQKTQNVISLGTVPLAGGFIEQDDLKNNDEEYYPLNLSFCKSCKMLQTTEAIDPEILFGNYYFYSSSKIQTLKDHFVELANEIASTFASKKSLVVEIGSNDAILVKELCQKNINILGIDPAKNLVIPQIENGLPLICDYFNETTATNILDKYGKADVITSSNTMAHIEDIASVYRGVKKLLKDDGCGIIEVHYLKKILDEFQYDMIYHEHMYYYSVISMSKILHHFDLELYDAKEIPLHAGSIRFYIQHKNGPRKISQRITKLIQTEKDLKLDQIQTYEKFNNSMYRQKQLLLKLLLSIKKNSKIIAGYGASGRGNTIMNFTGIDSDLLDYVIDDSQLKQGKLTPGNNLKIVDSKILFGKRRPDYVLLFAWSFYKEIRLKHQKYIENGGQFIIPLPSVKIVS